MTKETRDLLWREYIREYIRDGAARNDEAEQDDLIERAIERLLNRRRREE